MKGKVASSEGRGKDDFEYTPSGIEIRHKKGWPRHPFFQTLS
jgi:hypothetical protein